MVYCERCGTLESRPLRCRSRFCRHCARAKSMSWYHWAKRLDFRWPLMLTLTLKVGTDVEAMVDLAIESYTKLIRHLGARVRGAVRGVEVKPKRDGQWYVHVHALVDSRWLGHHELSDYWHKLTGSSMVVDVRRRAQLETGRAACEVVKYATKAPDRLTDAQVDYLSQATYGRRFVESCGKLSLLDTDRHNSTGLKCSACGARLVFVGFMPAEWAEDATGPPDHGPPVLLGLS